MADDLKNARASDTLLQLSSHVQERETRFPLAIQIEVHGIDRSGQPFSEKTVTSNVSHRGCRFMLRRHLERDAIVAIHVVRTLSERPADPQLVMFQIIYSKQEKDGWAMGAWTLQPDQEWCADIPDETEPGKSNAIP